MSDDSLIEKLFDYALKYYLGPLAMLFILVAPVLLCGAVYQAVTEARSPTIELKKNEWTCTKTYIYYTYVKGVRYQHEACSTYVKDGAG